MKTKPKLIPPDKNQCQSQKKEGAWPDAQHFMIFGPPRMVQCTAKPTVIIHEKKPNKDGLKGSMSLCDECLKKAIEQLGGDFFTSVPIKR